MPYTRVYRCFYLELEGMPGLDASSHVLPQYQSGCETNQTTIMMVPSKDYGGNRIRSQKAYRL